MKNSTHQTRSGKAKAKHKAVFFTAAVMIFSLGSHIPEALAVSSLRHKTAVMSKTIKTAPEQTDEGNIYSVEQFIERLGAHLRLSKFLVDHIKNYAVNVVHSFKKMDPSVLEKYIAFVKYKTKNSDHHDTLSNSDNTPHVKNPSREQQARILIDQFVAVAAKILESKDSENVSFMDDFTQRVSTDITGDIALFVMSARLSKIMEEYPTPESFGTDLLKWFNRYADEHED